MTLHSIRSDPNLCSGSKCEELELSISCPLLPPITTEERTFRMGSSGRVEDGRGRLGHAATLRFPSPLIEPDVPQLRHPALRPVSP